MAQPTLSKHLCGKMVAEVLEEVSTVLFDADGVLWTGPHAIPGAADCFNAMRRMGKRVVIVTNNNSRTRAEYQKKSAMLGFEPDEVMSSAYATAWYLKQQNQQGKVHILGKESIAKELDSLNIRHTDMERLLMDDFRSEDGTFSVLNMKRLKFDAEVTTVVVGYDEDVNYAKICKAASYIRSQGATFVATNTDQNMPMSGSAVICPGTGVNVSAVAAACGKPPDVVIGKPNNTMMQCLVELLGCALDLKRTMMVGDNITTDMLFATNGNVRSLFVQTGVSTLDDVVDCEESGEPDQLNMVPTYYAQSLASVYEDMKMYCTVQCEAPSACAY